MAVRGVPERRAGGALAGVLRDLDRKTRRTRRAPVSVAPEPAGEEAAATTPAGPVAMVVKTGEDGRAVLQFPRPFAEFPVVAASAVVADSSQALVVFEEATCKHVVMRVWNLRHSTPVAMAGVAVHVTATESN